jgi:putative DNA primase/helicase
MKPFDRIPEEMRKLPNWVVWKLEERTDAKGEVRETKVPYDAKTGKLAKTNAPATWASFDKAVAALRNGNGYDGIGFCLSADYVGIDLDGCSDAQGNIEPWATRIIRELETYTETSPSGTGVRIIARGKLPPGRRRKDFTDREHHGLEMYDAASPRYLTMTGQTLNGNAIALRTKRLKKVHERLFPPKPQPKPKPPSPNGNVLGNDDDLIARAKKADDSGKFGRLWSGDTSGYPSQSEADLALCSKLAFWTGCDATRMDTLFRRSGLMREKWERADYRDGTIAKAISGTTEAYQPGKPPAGFDGSDGLGVARQRAGAGGTAPPDLLAPHFSDYGNSRRLIALCGEDLRYCHDFRKWLVWDGTRWEIDTGDRSRQLAHQTILEFGKQAFAANNKVAITFASTSLGSQRITNMLHEAQPDLRVRVDDLDRDPDLLNFTNGTVDLKSGKLRAHRRRILSPS